MCLQYQKEIFSAKCEDKMPESFILKGLSYVWQNDYYLLLVYKISGTHHKYPTVLSFHTQSVASVHMYKDVCRQTEANIFDLKFLFV